MSKTRRVLTGVKPTGRPHLGNYLGSIRPSLALSEGVESFLFVADLHALTTVRDGEALRRMVREVAATWIACGLDPARITFYKQSDVPEIAEISWRLACFTGMGLLERAHAYKAAKDAGQEVNAGLFTYPVLMAADILSFQATHVPVGQDQKQHLEIARDIANSFNHHFGEVLVLPEPVTSDEVAVVPGLDGRKMSKSYDNTIPIFDDKSAIKKKVYSIVSDSTPLEEPKDPASSNIWKLYRLLVSQDRAEAMADSLRAGGYGWGHAKKDLLDALLELFEGPRARFDELMADPAQLDAIFAEGAAKARPIAADTLAAMDRALGVRS